MIIRCEPHAGVCRHPSLDAGNRTLTGDKRSTRGLIAAVALLALALPASAPAAFPPGENGRIAHISSPGGSQSNVYGLWDMGPTGGDFRNLGHPGARMPAYFPDGKQIVFSYSAGSGTGLDLYVKGADGGPATRITSLSGDETSPTVSPDGHFIAFDYGVSGRRSLYRMELGSAPVVMSSTPDEFIFGPDYSPDGSSIVFRRLDQHLSDGDSGGIVRLDLDTGAERRLSTSTDDVAPHYSPDGNSIAFARYSSGTAGGPTRSIWVMSSSDGSGKHRVLGPFDGTYSLGLGGYSPDGSKLVYSRAVGGQFDIFVAPAGGGSSTNLTEGSGVHDTEPAWQRLSAEDDGGGPGDGGDGGDGGEGDGGDGGALGEVSGGRCSGRDATITGTDRKDYLKGTRGRDVIALGRGSDVVFGLGGGDVVCGDGGRDTLLGQGGRDTLLGGAGKDTLWGGPRRDLLLGGRGFDRLIGGGGRDLYGAGDKVFP